MGSDSGDSKRHLGTVRKWIIRKGFGFITPDEEGIAEPSKEDEEGKSTGGLLMHHNEMKQEGTYKRVEEGTKVEFSVTVH